MAASLVKFEKFSIPSSEANARLEIVVAKPQHQGPYPIIIFNHGSTGRGHNKSLYSRTRCPPVVANYFVERGWMILFPQRRGRGKSGGTYGEGLAPDGSGYSCNVEIALAGFERAVEDLDAVVRHLRERSDVDQSQLAIGEPRAVASCRSHMRVCAQLLSEALSISTADGSAELAPIMKS